MHKVNLSTLSWADGQPVVATDLGEGRELLLDYDKKSYNVTLHKIVGKKEAADDGMVEIMFV